MANKWPNPYFAALKAADFIIATGDSIAMCSEICCLKKPVYIFNPPQICSAKHLKFHQNLFEQNFTKKLDEKTEILENYSPQKLDETSRIAKLIIEKIRL
jgi:mitochondrial fission protein ELM1